MDFDSTWCRIQVLIDKAQDLLWDGPKKGQTTEQKISV